MKNAGPVEEKHQLWLDTPDTEKNKPSLPLLYDLKVIEKVCTQYGKFGTMNDEDGSVLEVIENDSGEVRTDHSRFSVVGSRERDDK